MRYRAIIFDMDGTIADTNHVWETAIMMTIENHGGLLNRAEQDQFKQRTIGMALHECCEVIRQITNIKESSTVLVNHIVSLVRQLHSQHARLMHGFESFHQKTRLYNLKTGLATNSCQNTTSSIDQHLNLKQFFGEHIYTISHVNNRGKPAPDLYLFAAQQLAEQPEHCIAIEDSAHGISAAKAAGLFCIGFNSAGDYHQVKDAHHIVDSYDDIELDMLLEIKS